MTGSARQGSAVLSAEHRLRRRVDFAATMRRGARARRDGLVVHVAGPARPTDEPAQRADPVRVGFVVGRAVGPAVVRNRLRRRLRHLVRDRLGSLRPGTDLVIRADAGAAGRAYRQLAQDLDGALASARSRAGGRRAG